MKGGVVMALCFADFEFTCGGKIVRGEVELLSIGLVICNDSADAVIDTFYDTVLPIRHPRLTKQCIKLTKLEQRVIDASFDAEYICSKVNALLDRYGIDKIFVWGNYDTVGLSSNTDIFNGLALKSTELTHTRDRVVDIQKSVMKRFGTDDIINVKDLSRALDFTPDGSFHNALVDAQALYCIYSHSLHPETGCEKVYELLTSRLEQRRERELEQKREQEERIKSIIENMSGDEKALYSQLITDGRTGEAKALVKLHLAVDKQFSKLPKGSDIVAVSYRNSSRISLVDKKSFVMPDKEGLSFKSYAYTDKEKIIIDGFEERSKKQYKAPYRKKCRTKAKIRS